MDFFKINKQGTNYIQPLLHSLYVMSEKQTIRCNNVKIFLEQRDKKRNPLFLFFIYVLIDATDNASQVYISITKSKTHSDLINWETTDIHKTIFVSFPIGVLCLLQAEKRTEKANSFYKTIFFIGFIVVMLN